MNRRLYILLIMVLQGTLAASASTTTSDSPASASRPSGRSAWNDALYVQYRDTILIRGSLALSAADILGNGTLLRKNTKSRHRHSYLNSAPYIFIDNPDAMLEKNWSVSCELTPRYCTFETLPICLASSDLACMYISRASHWLHDNGGSDHCQSTLSASAIKRFFFFPHCSFHQGVIKENITFLSLSVFIEERQSFNFFESIIMLTTNYSKASPKKQTLQKFYSQSAQSFSETDNWLDGIDHSLMVNF